MRLIFCQGGNRRFMDIAVNAGYWPGTQYPKKVYVAPHFMDQDWKCPDRQRYMAGLAQYRPTMATVLDWERHDQLPEVLDWAAEAAQYVQQVVIIPKVHGGIDRLPRAIGTAEIVLGYSVPTKFGGTDTQIAEFQEWPVHLLGGSPHRQMQIAHYVTAISADGSMPSTMACRAKYWDSGRWVPIEHGSDAPYRAFAQSCRNIMAAWGRMTAVERSGQGEATP